MGSGRKLADDAMHAVREAPKREPSRFWKAVAAATIAHIGLLSFGHPFFENKQMGINLAAGETARGKRPSDDPRYFRRNLESYIEKMAKEDANAFPESDMFSVASLYPKQIPGTGGESTKHIDETKPDALPINANSGIEKAKDADQEEEAAEIPELKPASNGIRPLQINTNHPKEPSTLEELKRARGAFQAQLLFDLKDDAAGQVKLDSMLFIEFFVRSWYYKHAIGRLEKGLMPLVTPERLYSDFESIMSAAKSRIHKDHSPIQRDLIFHQSAIAFLKGYEKDHRDIYSALEEGWVNCDSATQLGVSGFTQLDPNARINLFSDHVQSVTAEKGRWVVIENTSSGNPLYSYSRGFLTKPEKYVSDYLISDANGLAGALPDEVKGWYLHPLERFGKKPPPGFMPFSESQQGDAVDIQGPQPFQLSPSAHTAFLDEENAHADKSSGASGKSPHRPGSERANSIALVESLLASTMHDFSHIQSMVTLLMRNKLFTITDYSKAINHSVDTMLEKSLYEEFHIYEDGERYVASLLPKPPRPFIDSRPVLATAIRDSDFLTERVGLLEDLRYENPGGRISDSLALYQTPAVDYKELGNAILDNRLLLIGRGFRDQVTGIYQRDMALRRAELFGTLGTELSASRDSRVASLISVIEGKVAPDFDTLFAYHQGYTSDPFVSLRDMRSSKAKKGISVFAIEDLLAFKGERETVDIVMNYLGRKDIELDRIGFGLFMASLNSRLVYERGYLRNGLEGILADKGRSISMRAASAQFLFLHGSRDARISSALGEYLKESDFPTRAEVSNLLATGLEPKTAKKIMEERFAESIFESNLTLGHLIINPDLAPDLRFQRTDYSPTKTAQMIEAFRILEMMNDPAGMERMQSEIRHDSVDMKHNAVLLGSKSNAVLDVNYVAGNYSPTGNVPSADALKLVLSSKYPQKGGLDDLQLRFMRAMLDTNSGGYTQNQLFYSKGLLSAIIGSRGSQAAEYLPDTGIEYTRKELKYEPARKIFMGSAIAYNRLGKGRKARDLLTEFTIDSYESAIESRAKCKDNTPLKCGVDNARISMLAPLVVLSDMGLSRRNIAELRDSIAVRDMNINHRLVFCDEFRDSSILSELIPRPDILHYLNEPFREMDSNLVIDIILFEAHYHALDELIRKQPEDLRSLAIYLDICGSPPLSTGETLAKRIIRSYVAGYPSANGIHISLATMLFFDDLTKTDVNELLRVASDRLVPTQFQHYASTVLAVKGYLSVDSQGNVVIQDPPKPIRGRPQITPEQRERLDQIEDEIDQRFDLRMPIDKKKK